MNRKLAIKGHSTRGNKVIEILEMMGEKNRHNLNGLFSENAYYLIGGPHNDEILGGEYMFGNENIYWFTLEEFLKKHPFKIGDQVMDGKGNSLTIKSMSWSTDCETMVYDFEETEDVLATEDLLKYNAEFLVNKEKGEENGKMLCDITLNHLHRISLKNVLSELYEHIKTTPKEELEREFEEIAEWSNVGPTVEEFMDFYNKVNKKPKYPKTYEECCKVLRISPEFLIKYSVDGNDTEGDAPLIKKFIKLKRCRDAYWKIYGEDRGLDKPWKPDWNDGIQKYCIRTDRNKIVNCSSSFNNRILAFPTVEMRNVFYENFKDLIEQCKELL